MIRMGLGLAFATALVARPALASEPPDPTAVEVAPSKRVPERGIGMMTGGSYLLIGGTGLLVLSSWMTAEQDPNLGAAVFGSAALMATGATFIALGHRRAARFQTWSAQQGLRPPPDGRGLLISGIVVGGGGLIGTLAGGLMLLGGCEACASNRGVWFGMAGTAVAAGIGMVVGGAVLRKRDRAWRAGVEQARTQLAPSFAFSPRGAHFGVALRF